MAAGDTKIARGGRRWCIAGSCCRTIDKKGGFCSSKRLLLVTLAAAVVGGTIATGVTVAKRSSSKKQLTLADWDKVDLPANRQNISKYPQIRRRATSAELIASTSCSDLEALLKSAIAEEYRTNLLQEVKGLYRGMFGGWGRGGDMLFA